MICPTCDGTGTLRRDTNRVDCPHCDGAGWTPTRKPAPVSAPAKVCISLEEYERVCVRVRELEAALLPFAVRAADVADAVPSGNTDGVWSVNVRMEYLRRAALVLR